MARPSEPDRGPIVTRDRLPPRSPTPDAQGEPRSPGTDAIGPRPNFGPSAPFPLRFGFVIGQSDLFGRGSLLFQHGIDNWLVEIHRDASTLFADGFESGDTEEWSLTVP